MIDSVELLDLIEKAILDAYEQTKKIPTVTVLPSGEFGSSGIVHVETNLAKLIEFVRVQRAEAQDSCPILVVSHADLEGMDYDVSLIDRATLKQLAEKIGAAYTDSAYWIDLPIIADHLQIPKKKHCVILDCREPLAFTNDKSEYFCATHAAERQDQIDQRMYAGLVQEAGRPELEWDAEKIADQRAEIGLDDEYPYLIETEASCATSV